MLLGKQEPTKDVKPISVSSYGDKAFALSKKAGITLLPWQHSLLDVWLGVAGSGDWSSSSAGLAVPRQNGKTQAVVARMAFGMVAFNEWCIYTSHLQKTSTETFESLRALFESPALSGYVKDIKTALGREEIVLKSGGRAKFLARTRNGGRGQHSDLLLFDEANELSDEQQASFIPILAASRRPQVLYCGTPPDENAQGEAFVRMRAKALSGSSSSMSWQEWSVAEIGDTSNKERWAATNPSYGYLLKETTIEAEHDQMASDKFARERLGYWSENIAASVITAEQWKSCATASPPTDGTLCYAVKFSPDGSIGSLAVCLKPKEGCPHVELVAVNSLALGTRWFVDWLVERKDKPAQVVIDGMANAQQLVDELLRNGYKQKVLIKPKASAMAAACSAFLNAIKEKTVTHYDQEQLNESATKSKQRNIGSSGGWGFADNGCTSTAIEAAALAYWAAINTKRNPNRKTRVCF